MPEVQALGRGSRQKRVRAGSVGLRTASGQVRRINSAGGVSGLHLIASPTSSSVTNSLLEPSPPTVS